MGDSQRYIYVIESLSDIRVEAKRFKGQLLGEFRYKITNDNTGIRFYLEIHL
jgi:hypothetical protein